MRHTNKRQARPEKDPKTAKLQKEREIYEKRERESGTARQADDLDCVAWTKTELRE